MGVGPFSTESRTSSDTRQENNSLNLAGNSFGIAVRKGGAGNTTIKVGRGGVFAPSNQYSGLDTDLLSKIYSVLSPITGLPETLPVQTAKERAEQSNTEAKDDNAAFGATAILHWLIGALAIVAIVAVLKVFSGKKG